MRCASEKKTYSTITGNGEATQSPGQMTEKEIRRRIELKKQFVAIAMRDIEEAVNYIDELKKRLECPHP